MPKPYHTPKSERDDIASAIEVSEALWDLELAETAAENTAPGSMLDEFNRTALANSADRHKRALEARR